LKHPEAPVIEGYPVGQSLAERIMGDPAGAHREAEGGDKLQVVTEYFRPATVLELITGIPGRTSMPIVAQVFMLTALQEFSAAVAAHTPDQLQAFDQQVQDQAAGATSAQWQEVAKQINHIITEHIEWANSQPDEQENEPMATEQLTQEARQYLARLGTVNWAQPVPEDLIDMARRLDPTGEIASTHITSEAREALALAIK
jgi:hypothetical protein